MTRPQEKDISAKTGLIECHKKETAAGCSGGEKTRTYTGVMSALEENQEWEAVNRIVFPTTDAESTLPLYVVNWTPSHPDPALFDARESLEKVTFSSLSKPPALGDSQEWDLFSTRSK